MPNASTEGLRSILFDGIFSGYDGRTEAENDDLAPRQIPKTDRRPR